MYLDMKNIDYDLRIRIRKYLEFLYEEKNAMLKEGNAVVSSLSYSLKTEIFQRLNGEVIVNIPVMIKNFSLKLLSNLTLVMKEASYTPEDSIFEVMMIIIYFLIFFLYKNKYLFKEGELDEKELYYIYEGEVEIFIKNSIGMKEDTKLKKLKVILNTDKLY